MLDVTIDVAVFAVPSFAALADEVHRYVERLLGLGNLLDERWINVNISEKTPEILLGDDLYPTRDQLGAIFRDHGIVEYNVNTVARVVDRLLAQIPRFETCYRVRNVLADPVLTCPNIFDLITRKEFYSELSRCVMLIAIMRKHCPQALAGHWLVLSSAPRGVVRVRAEIHDSEHDRDDLSILQDLPHAFEGDVLVCEDFGGLLGCLDEIAIFRDARDARGLELAIKVAMFKESLKKTQEPDWSNTPVPVIGKQFLESSQGCCRNQGGQLVGKIVRAIVETMLGQNMAAVHGLRTRGGGNVPQRTRGKDKAQRRDIDYEFHLHYWECEGGVIELASVVSHNDFTIPY